MNDVREIVPGVVRIPTGISNAYMVGSAGHWTLIDCGTGGYASTIREAASEYFGANARPAAILLTHGHFDHAGSAEELARDWNVRVFAHGLELPYLTGKSKYPPPDPTVGGFMSQVIRLFPNKAYDLGDVVSELNVGAPQSLQGWQCIETPGHSPGHVSFFREQDGALIAGDAFCTIDQDSMIGVLSKKPQVSRPPAYYTCDWDKAHESVRRLAELMPRVLMAGHGEPMQGEDALRQLRHLADNFPAPTHGRYVGHPPVTNEDGVVYLPPPAPDPVKKVAIAAIAAGTAAAILIAMRNTNLKADDWLYASGETEPAAPEEPRSWQWRKPA